MSEIRLAQPASAQSEREGKENPAVPGVNEIRLLDDLELALAGGGDQDFGWP